MHTAVARQGSSPRMRGTLSAFECTRFPQGIIPADAGNTFSSSSLKASLRDHPRGCGEHGDGACACRQYQGSSPRMRGTRPWVLSGWCCAGIIPADAGNTDPDVWVELLSRDHPRGCGEHPQIRPAGVRPGGSSPRMRGTHRSWPNAMPSGRIIPADAGNTL